MGYRVDVIVLKCFEDANNDDEDTLIQGGCDSLEVFCKQRIASTQRAIERVSGIIIVIIIKISIVQIFWIVMRCGIDDLGQRV